MEASTSSPTDQDHFWAEELSIPGAKDGTARNMNTVAKLAQLAEASRA